MGVEARRHEETAYVRLSQDKLPVRGKRLGSVGELDHLALLKGGNPSARALEERFKPVPIRVEELVAEAGWDTIEREGRRLSAVAPGYYVALVRPEVYEIIRVTHGGEVRRNSLLSPYVHVLVLERGQGHGYSDEPAYLGGPDARGVHHHFGLNCAVVRNHLFYAPVLHRDPGNGHAGVDLHSPGTSPFS